MNRNLRESLTGGRNFQFRRGLSLNGFSEDSDENLDLFSTSRRSFPLPSSDVSGKLGRLSVASITLPKVRADDLLCSTEGGKHDYDWLLTPPGTPLGSQSPSTLAAPKTRSSSRSSSAAKASRLSVSHSESSYQSSRPTRSSSSVTRPSISTSQYSLCSLSRPPSSVLNTSSGSVSSYIRPSSPITRSSSTARPLTPARTTSSGASTPSRMRPSSSSSSIDKTKPSRPSTPTSRPQLSANSSTTASRPSSRPSTPTRRNPSTSVSASAGPYVSGGRVASKGASFSRPSSPGPIDRPPQQPIVPPDFPLETPPNLRTTLPDRAISAGRSRPVAATATKVSPEPKGSMTRRNPSPIVGRGRLTEAPGKGRVSGNGHLTDVSEPRKGSNVSDIMSGRSVKSSGSVTESNGLVRSFSKSSLDMAIRHMDARNGKGSGRALSSTKSIRTATSKIQSIRTANEREYCINSHSGDLKKEGRLVGKMGMYESWLHGIDDKSSDQALVFDKGLELLPEPFAPL